MSTTVEDDNVAIEAQQKVELLEQEVVVEEG